MVRRHIFFYGRVQGVGFRWHAVSKARLLGLTGWVRNLSDGSVEMEVQGTQTRIGELLGYLYEQRYIRIEDIKSEDMELKEESSFRERW
ncbi:acylphosphatase [Lachnoclostridium sp. An196]|uniref:acylphosphatase n=1 Tax=Lachnoclostridium sp. An196 TaxID=1965583 RepID=UPI000B39E2EF|nr:acylphosphatase [Lachnoclostridium sp. An196]OUP21672.1 acylphosphatase [Lachnoclostridium sp. An196]HIS07691.1 acylphosphatase [Candidatus Choladocola avistercoris]